MSDEKKILYPVVQSNEGNPTDHADYVFWCPGCGHAHAAWTTKKNCVGAQWTFNGNMERPTFNPSIKVLLGENKVCHFFIRDGRIEYCGDSFHSLRGQSVPMEAF